VNLVLLWFTGWQASRSTNIQYWFGCQLRISADLPQRDHALLHGIAGSPSIWMILPSLTSTRWSRPTAPSWFG